MTQITARNLWAPIVSPQKGKDWIVWTCVRYTRREARNAYLEGINPNREKEHLARVRFAKVTIKEQP